MYNEPDDNDQKGCKGKEGATEAQGGEQRRMWMWMCRCEQQQEPTGRRV
jgi:hypothetical protein